MSRAGLKDSGRSGRMERPMRPMPLAEGRWHRVSPLSQSMNRATNSLIFSKVCSVALGVGGLGCIVGFAAPAVPVSAGVTLVQNAKTATLSNGIVTALVKKDSACILSYL